MNDKNTSHKQKTYEQDTTEKTTKTTIKKDGFLKKILKSILNLKKMEGDRKVTYSQKSRKDFEDELSMGGKLKNSYISKTSHSAEAPKGKQKSTDRGR